MQQSAARSSKHCVLGPEWSTCGYRVRSVLAGSPTSPVVATCSDSSLQAHSNMSATSTGTAQAAVAINFIASVVMKEIRKLRIASTTTTKGWWSFATHPVAANTLYGGKLAQHGVTKRRTYS